MFKKTALLFPHVRPLDFFPRFENQAAVVVFQERRVGKHTPPSAGVFQAVHQGPDPGAFSSESGTRSADRPEASPNGKRRQDTLHSFPEKEYSFRQAKSVPKESL